MYRERGERFQDNCIIERDSHGGEPVMVWAGVSLHHKTNIVFIKGNLSAARYQQEVLNTEVIPLLRNHRGTSCCTMVLQPISQGPPLHI